MDTRVVSIPLYKKSVAGSIHPDIFLTLVGYTYRRQMGSEIVSPKYSVQLISQEANEVKKIFLLVTLVSLILITTTLVSADSPNSAVVIHDDTCWVPDGTGSLEFDDLWEIPNCCTVVETFGKPGVKKFSCHAQLPEEAVYPEKTMLLTYENTDEFECWWDIAGTITTDDYLFTLTPSGVVNFHCMFKN